MTCPGASWRGLSVHYIHVLEIHKVAINLASPAECGMHRYPHATQLRPWPGALSTARYTSRRGLHSTSVLRNHYETLGLAPDATPADIKKAFYKLSKKHHPDHNPDNQQEAAQAFGEISGAYQVLSDPKQRERYNQQNLQFRPKPSSSTGSGFSAGARKGAGLNRRRGTFRGPPPSFYQSAASSARRKANQESSAYEQGAQRPAGAAGSWPFGADPNDVPHFDRDGHYKSQSKVETQLERGRRKRRVIHTTGEDDGIMSVTLFISLVGVVAFGISVPVYLSFGRL